MICKRPMSKKVSGYSTGCRCEKCTKRHREYAREWRNKNKEKYLAWSRDWYKNHPGSVKNSKLKSYYGITLETYRGMVTQQEGKCAICFKSAKLFVDHCHATRIVRGLLCVTCNTGLGYYFNRTDLLANAINYLNKTTPIPPQPVESL